MKKKEDSMKYEVLYKKEYAHDEANECVSPAKPMTDEDRQNARDFIDRLCDSITTEPLPQREECVTYFVRAAIELSARCSLDIEIRKYENHISVDFSFDKGCVIRGQNRLFQMADEITIMPGLNGRDVVLTLDYFTHAIYRNGRQISP